MKFGHTAAWRIVPIAAVVLLASLIQGWAAISIFKNLFRGFFWGEFGVSGGAVYKTTDAPQQFRFEELFETKEGEFPVFEDYEDELIMAKSAPTVYLVCSTISRLLMAMISVMGIVSVVAKLKGWSSFMLAMLSFAVLGFECIDLLLMLYMFVDNRFLMCTPIMRDLWLYSKHADMFASQFKWPTVFFISLAQKIPTIFIYNWFVDAFWSFHLIHLCGGSGWERKAAGEFPKWPRVEASLKQNGVMGLNIFNDMFCILDSEKALNDNGGQYGTETGAEAILRQEELKDQERAQRQREVQRHQMQKAQQEAQQDAQWVSALKAASN